MAATSENDVDKCQSSEEDMEKKRVPRRTSQRLRKKPRITVDYSSDSENEKIVPRKRKTEKSDTKPPTSYVPRKMFLSAGTVIPNYNNFLTSCFVVQKHELQQSNNLINRPGIWRIDGKALLQKFEVFEDKGKQLHRSTSIYTGWSVLDHDLYAPVNVIVQCHTAQQMVVEVDWEALKTVIVVDSE